METDTSNPYEATTDGASDAASPAKSGVNPKWVVVGLIIVGLMVGSRFLPLQEWWNGTSDWIASLGVWGPIAFILIYAIATVLFIPGSVLTLGAGAVFGVAWGSLWVILGSNLGANLAFLVGRYWARDAVAEKIQGNERFEAIDRAVKSEGWKIVGLTRLSPAFPFNLLNYAFGLTRVKWIHYMLATFIGMLPATVMYVYIGSLAKVAAESDQTSTARTVLTIVGLLATIAVTVMVTRMAKKALNEKTGL